MAEKKVAEQYWLYDACSMKVLSIHDSFEKAEEMAKKWHVYETYIQCVEIFKEE